VGARTQRTAVAVDVTVPSLGPDVDRRDGDTTTDAIDRETIPWRTVRRVVALVLAMLLVRLLVIETFTVDGSSMTPTFRDGDRIVVQKVSDLIGSPDVGDLVVLKDPLVGEVAIKRVVAVGGDSIELYDGVLRRNGVAIDEPYADQTDMGGRFFGPDIVPPGSVWVMGDHRSNSNDSRDYGPVPHGNIIGRYVLRIWPFG
jgi:signal peptidase I